MTVALLHPSRRIFTVQKTTVTDTAIHTNGMRDLYAVLGDERDGAAVLRLHVNPLAPWIWLGALVMAIGGALSLADRRLRVGAPARRVVARKWGWCRDQCPLTPTPPATGGGVYTTTFLPLLVREGWGQGTPMTPIQRRVCCWRRSASRQSAACRSGRLLERLREGSYDPHGVPSVLIGKPCRNSPCPARRRARAFPAPT